ncbi:MAG: endonuclease MutS2 [Halanaerobiaceae bacterium]|nr:endonuclease MutS2 [Halanaerobiaceae bacterium]
MDSAVKTLELDKIKNEAAQMAATKLAREAILNLTPVSDFDYVKKSLQEVSIACSLIREFGPPPFGGIQDLREILKKAGKGIVLSVKELVDVRNTLYGFNALKRYFDQIKDNLAVEIIDNYYKPVIDVGDKISLLPVLAQELDKCLDDYGGIRDTASPKLAGIRSEKIRLSREIQNWMESIISNSRFQKMLQDTLITKRRDRYVVPVKSEYRNAFQGIVHDQSASGVTLFIEPLQVVNLNNRMSELDKEEEKEINRNLNILSEMVAEELVIIQVNLEAATVLDMVFAKAEYSRKTGGIEPEINDQGIVNIVQGRHPLLREKAVPINIRVGGDFNTLVITGPNTGGKTVALKTVGLFVLMAECGFHIPAERGTDLAVFKKVFVDIGDEQSIEQNLSTFSSHINRIKEFLEKADQGSLVLMDELGAGTDPSEGSALGIAIMDELLERKAVTIVTTHYSQLKNYAYNKEGVENASVDFDINTLEPTYRILMGIPGGSNAFAIARRLGVPEEIVEKASSLLSEDEISVERIITELNQERDKYEKLKKDYELRLGETAVLKKEYETLLESLEMRKQDIIEKARERAAEIINKAEKETRNILQDLKKREFTSRAEIDRKGNEIKQAFSVLEKMIEAEEQAEGEPEPDIDFIPGEQVRIRSTGATGQIISVDREKGEAVVQAGIMTIKAGFADLVKIKEEENKEKKMIAKYRVSKSTRVKPTLDLRGERYENAVSLVEKYLDNVFLAGYKQVELIHGKGTGALREAVWSVLKEHKHVLDYRLGYQEEGGTGVTIVTIQ